MKFSGDGYFTNRCQDLIQSQLQAKKIFLTPSGTDALEMSALLADIKPGDEVVMPSYTFVSTANAFILRGANVVFVDIRPDTMNIDEQLIEQAITDKTKAIVPVHYAGVACEMDSILEIAKQHGLYVIEDAAQALFAFYKGQALGTLGDFSCFSFHETKNFSCGEGGAISINDQSFINRAEIIREKGTNKNSFIRGEIKKYTWEDIGSSFLPSELQSAYLFAHLESFHKINRERMAAWQFYYDALKSLESAGQISLPANLPECEHNAHIFYIKVKSLQQRTALSQALKQQNIDSVFHYLPLHTAKMGQRFGRFSGHDRYTTQESQKLLRLPLFYGISQHELERVVTAIEAFFKPC